MRGALIGGLLLAALPALAADDVVHPIRFAQRCSQSCALDAVARAAGFQVRLEGPLRPGERQWALHDLPPTEALEVVLAGCQWALVAPAAGRGAPEVMVFGGCSREAPAVDTGASNPGVRSATGPGVERAAPDAMPVEDRLRSEDPAVRLQAVRSLSLQRDSESLRVLAQVALGDRDSAVRVKALEALAYYQDAFARGVIANAARDPDPDVARIARRLGGAGPGAAR